MTEEVSVAVQTVFSHVVPPLSESFFMSSGRGGQPASTESKQQHGNEIFGR
jgi:hypothetical protein